MLCVCQNFAKAYVDITVFRLNWQEHLQHLEEMLVQNQQAGFKVKLKNVVLAKPTHLVWDI